MTYAEAKVCLKFCLSEVTLFYLFAIAANTLKIVLTSQRLLPQVVWNTIHFILFAFNFGLETYFDCKCTLNLERKFDNKLKNEEKYAGKQGMMKQNHIGFFFHAFFSATPLILAYLLTYLLFTNISSHFHILQLLFSPLLTSVLACRHT